ncbi:MAG: hypothetical protein LBU53_04035 [Zoogloeaceae bacterium]|jgi:hypothetical protein|nr:hypothetical protein [Zoogloeaceae bacterium]
MMTVQFKNFLPAAGALRDLNTWTMKTAQPLAARTTDAEDKKAEEKKAEEKKESTQVNLSDFGKRQAQALNMLNSLNAAKETRKAAARAQAAELKKRIDSLKEIAAMLGPLAAKTILRQIKQIAQQLRSIAAELSEPSTPDIGLSGGETANASAGSATGGETGGENVAGAANGNSGATTGEGEGEEDAQASSEDNVAAEAAAAQQKEDAEEAKDAPSTDKDAGTEAAAAEAGAAAGQAEQAARAAESEVKDKEQNKGVSGNDELANLRRAQGMQERQDARMISELAKELRQLASWAKSMLIRKDKEDKETIEEIEKQLAETDKLVQELSDAADVHLNDADILAGMDASADGAERVDAAVSVGDVAAVSVSVFA